MNDYSGSQTRSGSMTLDWSRRSDAIVEWQFRSPARPSVSSVTLGGRGSSITTFGVGWGVRRGLRSSCAVRTVFAAASVVGSGANDSMAVAASAARTLALMLVLPPLPNGDGKRVAGAACASGERKPDADGSNQSSRYATNACRPCTRSARDPRARASSIDHSSAPVQCPSASIKRSRSATMHSHRSKDNAFAARRI